MWLDIWLRETRVVRGGCTSHELHTLSDALHWADTWGQHNLGAGVSAAEYRRFAT